MDADVIRQLVADLDTRRSSEEELAWARLRPLGSAVVPHLAEAYPRFRTWQGRASLLYHAIQYARTEEAAFQLGLAALRDRSFVVRYRACMLVAYSLRDEAVPLLEDLLQHPEPRTAADAGAALDAIRQQNHHLFLDRDHSGKVFLRVRPSDRTA